MKQIQKNFKQKSDGYQNGYYNILLENINDHCLRLAVFQGEYRWHYHKNTEELFIVFEGQLKIEIKNEETVYLRAGDFIKIPASTVHKTSAEGRVVNLCFEKSVEDTILLWNIPKGIELR
jgi:mannose-6-phosphate isomerase-like protein (cupin superfamily)